jgi:hypothetical protein
MRASPITFAIWAIHDLPWCGPTAAAQNLVNLTGWPLANVLAEMEATGQPTR